MPTYVSSNTYLIVPTNHLQPSFDISLGFGDNGDPLENFDFDSFLHTGTDDNVISGFTGDFDFQSAEVDI